MLTRLTIRNFKRFDEVDIELGGNVVFIGPNNSGKTTALQALALWEVGLRRWESERGEGQATPKKRPGVTINRKDLLSLPVPTAKLLWRACHVRDSVREGGKPATKNVLIDVLVEGEDAGAVWRAGFEFDYANAESFYCRPLRASKGNTGPLTKIPPEATNVSLAYLPPMSGLASNETRLDPGAVKVRLGEGRTAEVLRNICFHLFTVDNGKWIEVKNRINGLFGVELGDPAYIEARGEITMSYREPNAGTLDISSSGRGLQQTLLVLAYLAANPNRVLLLDEPDAHLEILRQRDIYRILSESARESGSQVIAASHSEVVLNEAAEKDVVIAFVGRPHRMNDRKGQVAKALKEIGWEDYHLAELEGWVLYLEGSTDLYILRGFAERLGHRAAPLLVRPFVKYVGNQPRKASAHFHGLREAKSDLVGFAIYDRLEKEVHSDPNLAHHVWERREIENYLCSVNTLLNYAEGATREGAPLFSGEARREMETSLEEFVPRAARKNPTDPFWFDTKISEDVLPRILGDFHKRMRVSDRLDKGDYHTLVRWIPEEEVALEIREVLDRLWEFVGSIRPAPLPGEGA